ncbi:TPA: SIR2 family protein [Legionella pneumophila]|nr:SIR2 family protein [Legionella pneumophila]
MTLNFDVLLEQALEKESSAPVVTISDSAGAPDGQLSVHHLHGVVSPQVTKDVVLTLTDFLDVLSDPESWQREYMRAALSRGALVIAGTSYRDPDVRQWLHAARKSAPDGHAALVILAREGFALTRARFEALTEALQAQWAAVGLRPILVDDHSDAAQAIRELRSVNIEGYRAPQERARMVWDYHQENFAVLQLEYSELLSADATRMRSVLDVENLNVSIWLSNGERRLARWAADDRVHRDLNGLRLVETGFDSPWIAGRALSADTLLIQDIEESGTRRWRSVAAVAVPMAHPSLPPMSTAVITVGLPGAAHEYEKSAYLWVEELSQIVDSWSTRLSAAVSAVVGGTI